MRQYELRFYKFKTPAAALDYAPRWRAHVESLKLFDIETHGYFLVPSDPCQVVAMVSYSRDSDPVEQANAYMMSDGFKSDMAGFDMTSFERVEQLLLDPQPGSALR